MEDDLLLGRTKKRSNIPFDFVFDLLEGIEVTTRLMFGCTAIYSGAKILLILREKEPDDTGDNGVWIATVPEHHASLKLEFPSMRSIRIFGGGPTTWQNLPSSSADFEEAVTKVCALIQKKDPRVGKIPDKKKAGAKRKPVKRQPVPKRKTKINKAKPKKIRSKKTKGKTKR